MNVTPQAIAKEVAATGFGAEPIEKVFRLMALLDALHSHPFLKTRFALKGGTALNLFRRPSTCASTGASKGRPDRTSPHDGPLLTIPPSGRVVVKYQGLDFRLAKVEVERERREKQKPKTTRV
jgi:hypothetical protein